VYAAVDVVPLCSADRIFGGRLGRPFTWVERCASTQRLLDGAPEGAVAATDEQTEGRGRLGRGWEAPPGSSLLFSIVLVPPVPAERLPELSVVAGHAVAEAVAAETGLSPTVKQPNDVLVGGRKVAGILAESSEGRVTLGIGINVSQQAEQLPERAQFPATSLAIEGVDVDRAALLATVLEILERRYDAWITDDAS
jgi:BirA family transcriptional regulator, biotin operon repressor / biotin---[acetyl-CoA-carboxylase] ligase